MIVLYSKIEYSERADVVVRSTRPALTKIEQRLSDMAILTQARLHEIFNYDPNSGHLLFKERPTENMRPCWFSRHAKKVGKPAGGTAHQGAASRDL